MLLCPGLHCLQYSAHTHPPALRRAALQVQALREGLRLPRGTRQPRPQDPRAGQAAPVRPVRGNVPGRAGAEIPR